MTQAHLSTARLQALHDGESGQSLELEHLASCSACQEAFDDTRWTMLLMRLRSRTDSADAHPGRDELLAYQIGALGTGREGSIRKHLAHCRRCVNEYGRIRVGRQQMRYSSPPRKTLQATMAQFRPRSMRRLGRLLIERAGEALAMSFLPAPRAAEAHPHPASASRRAMRLHVVADEDCMAVHDYASPSPSASIEGPSWNLRVEYVSGAAKENLQVGLTSVDDRQSAAKITIRIHSEDGDEVSEVTDAQGVASIHCPPGGSRLIVEVDPPLSLEIVSELND